MHTSFSLESSSVGYSYNLSAIITALNACRTRVSPFDLCICIPQYKNSQMIALRVLFILIYLFSISFLSYNYFLYTARIIAYEYSAMLLIKNIMHIWKKIILTYIITNYYINCAELYFILNYMIKTVILM